MVDLYVSSEEKEEKAVKKARNPLSAFLVRPKGVRFGIQNEDETIILLLRKHWITNVPWLLLTLVLFLAPFVLRTFPLIDFLPLRYQMMAILAWYLLVIAFIFEKFLSWFFNAYIITNCRMIDIDFYNLIYKQVTEADNEKIQDTTYQIGGVIRSLFNYGDVLVQTAGALPNLEFEAVPNPDQVVRVLNELREEAQREGGGI